jgi:hypothetical protein
MLHRVNLIPASHEFTLPCVHTPHPISFVAVISPYPPSGNTSIQYRIPLRRRTLPTCTGCNVWQVRETMDTSKRVRNSRPAALTTDYQVSQVSMQQYAGRELHSPYRYQGLKCSRFTPRAYISDIRCARRNSRNSQPVQNKNRRQPALLIVD